MRGATHPQLGMFSVRDWPSVKPMQGRLSTFLWALLFLAVVVGVETVVVKSLLSQWMLGHSGKVVGLGAFALLLLALFVVMALSTVHAGLSLLLPRVRLSSLDFTGRPGQSLSFAWSFSRTPAAIRRFHVVLEGFEQRRKGTSRNDYWKNQTVIKRPLFESQSPSDFEAGQLMVELPKNAKPTTMEKLYRMRWVIHLQGDVRFFPDLKETYEIKVLPEASTPHQ